MRKKKRKKKKSLMTKTNVLKTTSENKTVVCS